MKKLLAAFLIFISMNTMAQNTAYTTTTDKEDGGLIYNGRITFEDLNKESTFSWLKNGREEYKPDASTLEYLKMHINRYTMVVFLGTWCDDSHNIIPKLEKVLKMLDYPQSQLAMYGVDRDKKTKNGEHTTYAIKFVPTIILFKEGAEVGRITETVKKSIEADLMGIIRKDKSNEPQHK